MDWGFFAKNKDTGKRHVLRDDLVYRYRVRLALEQLLSLGLLITAA